MFMWSCSFHEKGAFISFLHVLCVSVPCKVSLSLQLARNCLTVSGTEMPGLGSCRYATHCSHGFPPIAHKHMVSLNLVSRLITIIYAQTTLLLMTENHWGRREKPERNWMWFVQNYWKKSTFRHLFIPYIYTHALMCEICTNVLGRGSRCLKFYVDSKCISGQK